MSLELAAQDWMGPQAPLVDAAWRTALVAASALVAEEPGKVARRLTAGLCNVALVPGARPDEWTALMAATAPQCATPAEWIACGGVAAWTSGVAHARPTAFALAKTLPPATARTALGLAGGPEGPPVEPLLAALEADPWLQPSRAAVPLQRRTLQLVRVVGGFRGFGGPFISPPDVWRVDDRFFLLDAEAAWVLHADARGATFVRAGRDRVDPSKAETDITPFAIGEGGRVTYGRQSRLFAECRDVWSSAADSTTLVVTAPRSHDVFVIAFAEEVRP